MRDYIGVDWADAEHAVWVEDEAGTKVMSRTVAQTVQGLGEWGRWLDERRVVGRELWAAFEKPEGRIVDFLLDHGVMVFPVNPKALDRARDRFRVSGAKSDPFDARVLATFLRTDHDHVAPLRPSSEAAQELKGLTRDYAPRAAPNSIAQSTDGDAQGVLPAGTRGVRGTEDRMGTSVLARLSDAGGAGGLDTAAMATLGRELPRRRRDPVLL